MVMSSKYLAFVHSEGNLEVRERLNKATSCKINLKHQVIDIKFQELSDTPLTILVILNSKSKSLLLLTFYSGTTDFVSIRDNIVSPHRLLDAPASLLLIRDSLVDTGWFPVQSG